jgi:NitT/TauT family transport system ATP-binding protein
VSLLELLGVSVCYGAGGAGQGGSRVEAGADSGCIGHALDDVTLRLERSEFVAVLGPSGAGKSTLLHVAAGLVLPTAGQVLLEGRPVSGPGVERAMIFQAPGLYPWLTAQGNVAFGLRIAGVGAAERAERAREALARVGLEGADALYPHELSGGMQQRVALARALVLDPAVLLMDEPLAAADPLLRHRLQGIIHTACHGRAALYVTHSLREALTLAHRVVMLTARPGRIRREIALDALGAPPRALTPELARIEREIEAGMMGEV